MGRGTLSLASLALACSTVPGIDDADGSGEAASAATTTHGEHEASGSTTETGEARESGELETTAAATSSPMEDESGSPVVYDLGSLPDAPELGMGCRKVDFLFVVDDSGSMSAQQARLVDSFPVFIDAIEAALDSKVDSYHVGVLSSDHYAGNAPGCTTRGDLVTQTTGWQSSNTICAPFAQGGRFATEQDDLEEKFPCMARVGASGSSIEQPVTALVSSFDSAKRGPGDCNEGFLRDDAILVVVIVTDDPPYEPHFDDAHPMTDTSGWHDAVVAAKHGDPEAMVVLGFVPWKDVGCVPLGLESPNLIGFVESFGEQGVLASVCEPDYGPIFAQTVQTIVSTCENFDPPG